MEYMVIRERAFEAHAGPIIDRDMKCISHFIFGGRSSRSVEAPSLAVLDTGDDDTRCTRRKRVSLVCIALNALCACMHNNVQGVYEIPI
jgi:hypothetical protein